VWIDEDAAVMVDRITGTGSSELAPARALAALWRDGEANVIRVTARAQTLTVDVNGRRVVRVTDGDVTAPGHTQLLISNVQQLTLRRLVVSEPTERDVAPVGDALPVFEDHFFDNRSGWTMPGDDVGAVDASIDGAGYHFEYVGRFYDHYWIVPKSFRSPVRNATVELDVTATGNRYGEYGVSLRSLNVRDVGNVAYSLLVSQLGGYRVWREQGFDFTELVPLTGTTALHVDGRPNQIRFTTHENVLSVSINGVKVARVEDSELRSQGYPALRASPGVKLAVRRVTLWDSAPEDIAPPTGVPPLIVWRAGDPDYVWDAEFGYVDGEEGGLYLESFDDRPAIAYPLVAGSLANVAITADLSPVLFTSSAARFGIGIGGPRSGPFRVMLNAGGALTLAHFPGAETPPDAATLLTPWATHASVYPGASENELRLVARGRTLEGWINGWLAARVELDHDIPAGAAHAFTGGTSDLQVRRFVIEQARAQ